MHTSRYSSNEKLPFALLVFDLDGTLIDTAHDIAHAVNYALRELGRTALPLAKVLRMVGDGARTLLMRALQNYTEAELQLALQAFREYYAVHLADNSRPYSGIAEVLAHFKHKKKAVFSNKPHEFTVALLERLQLMPQFEAVQGAAPHLPLKPDPTVLRDLLARLQVAPEQAVMIGDGENDMLVGKAAGTATCAVTYGFRPAENLLALAPDFVIHSPLDLLHVIA